VLTRKGLQANSNFSWLRAVSRHVKACEQFQSSLGLELLQASGLRSNTGRRAAGFSTRVFPAAPRRERDSNLFGQDRR